MNIGILDWTDENSKGDYPLSGGIGVKGVIVDAAFVQFNGLIPVLNTITVSPTTVVFNIKFDRVTKDITVDNTPFLDTRLIRIFEGVGTRYLGSIVLGQGFLKLFNDQVGSIISPNIPFAATTVVPINRETGVYSIQNETSLVNIATTNADGDQPIFFGIDTNTVIWNAVGIPPIPATIAEALKTLNGVSPTNNNIKIDDSEIIKINPGVSSITFDLANSVLNDNIGPTKNYE